MKRLALIVLCLAPVLLRGQTLAPEVRSFVSYNEPVIALEHVQLIDGTGAAARADQTLVIRSGKIDSLGPSSSARVPAGARRLDLTGRTIYPGIVGLHSHLFTFGDGPQGVTNPRLYLAAGITTAQTAGGRDAEADLRIRRDIDAGVLAGPRYHVTGPIMNGPLPGEAPAATVKRLAALGVTSFKIYTQANRAFAKEIIDAAHALKLKTLIHPCALTWREAIDLGIDTFAHGFSTATDFVPGKQPDVCPDRAASHGSLVALDAEGPEMRALYRHLIDHKVTVISTLPVVESFTPNRQPWLPGVLPLMTPASQKRALATEAQQNSSGNTLWIRMLKKNMEFERAYVRAGGLMAAGSDPTGPAMVAGHADLREIELLVEAGFTTVEAIKIATLHGAQYLGLQDRIGTLAPGKLADIVVLNGDPIRTITDIEKVETVFKEGVGYDATKLKDSVTMLVSQAKP